MSSEFEDTLETLEEEIVKGKALKIGDRTLYPVIEILTLEKGGKFWFKSVTPIAIAVLEPDNRYLIHLRDEEEIETPEKEGDTTETDDIWDELGINSEAD